MTNTAIILAAGRGQRLDPGGNREDYSKPLLDMGGKTLLERTIENCRRAKMKTIYIVTGFHADLVEQEVARLNQGDLRTVFNKQWTLSNGVSAYVCRDYVQTNFLLMMSDHVIDAALVERLGRTQPAPGSVMLAVDTRVDAIFDIDDATKVWIEGGKIVSIDKTLKRYNAIDCGLFHCTPAAFRALGQVYDAKGDCSLSDGMRVLAEEGRFHPFEIGDAFWQDVDTPEMMDEALRHLGA